jgi:hypothetical protein
LLMASTIDQTMSSKLVETPRRLVKRLLHTESSFGWIKGSI